MNKSLLSKEAVSALESRIQHEEFSSRLYEDMFLWFDDKGYKNLAKLYKKYSEEELAHAGWAKEFLLSYKIKPCLKPLQSPEAEYKDCKAILEATLEHETMITKECEALAVEALKRGEMTLYGLGMKYCAEQVEEMDKAYTLLDVYALTSCDLVFDQYVGDNLL
jgi:ferritin